MRSTSNKILRLAAWGISLTVAVIAVVAWGQSINWQIKSSYQLFPVFGLLAFSLMWGHYVVSALRRLYRLDGANLQSYFRITGWAVLILIVLHPGILVWQLWRDGFGLPPSSYLQHYVAPGLRVAAVLGTISLFIFLAFELQRVFGNRHWWRYMRYASDAAMLAIFYHGLNLGTQLHSGWLRQIWWFYGLILLITIIYNRWWDRRHRALSLVEMELI